MASFAIKQVKGVLQTVNFITSQLATDDQSIFSLRISFETHPLEWHALTMSTVLKEQTPVWLYCLSEMPFHFAVNILLAAMSEYSLQQTLIKMLLTISHWVVTQAMWL